MPEVAPEYVETRVTPPNKTFRESVGLELGDRPVTLTHFGRGHTDNDVIVVVPDAHVVFAGDLIEQGGPPSFEDSYPLDWPGTVGRMLDVTHGPVVPGHGDVVERSFVEGQLADLSALAEAGSPRPLRRRLDHGRPAAGALPRHRGTTGAGAGLRPALRRAIGPRRRRRLVPGSADHDQLGDGPRHHQILARLDPQHRR